MLQVHVEFTSPAVHVVKHQGVDHVGDLDITILAHYFLKGTVSVISSNFHSKMAIPNSQSATLESYVRSLS